VSQPSWIGHELGGRYVLEEMIGQGGMSAVYRAKDPNLRRVVAVKLIHSHLSNNPDFVRRFEEEAAAVAQLNHPNIIKVYDFNQEDGVYYMVLEFVPGETLQSRLKQIESQNRRMSTDEIIGVITDMCDAVGYAHKRGMLHRDIKPANIMLSTEGRAVLMDFGVVKMMGGQQHTATGAVIGTALYMSPEQVRGEHPDQRADIYSLGVTLFEMASGRPPFEADSAMSTLMMHLNDPVPDVETLNPDVPPGLSAIIEKALAKSPDDRFQSTAELAAALQTLQGGAAPAAPEATFIESPPVAQQAPEATFIEESPLTSPEPQGTFIEETAAVATAQDDTVSSLPTTGADTVASSSPPVPPPSSAASPPAKKGPNLVLLGGIGFIVLAVVVGVIVPGANLLGGGGRASDGGDTGENGGQAVEVAAVPTETPTTEPTLAPTDPPPPTLTPTPAETATPTVPPGIPYVRINDITVENGVYQVSYETFEYTPALPGSHIHFFFDTVPEENAGVPGNGPWIIYAGPIPFAQYTTADRPADATMMCALVANPDHTIQPGSGNCFALPEG